MFAIFTGEVNGVTNMVVRVNENVLRIAQASTSLYWRFDYESGEFVAVEAVGSNWAAQIVEMSGRSFQTAARYITEEVTMKMVDYKLSPAV